MELRPLKIFIVEDDEIYGGILERTLSLHGDYATKRFMCAADFFKHLNEKPDIVTLDFTLPDMNGDDILVELKRLYPETCVIVISGLDDIKTAIELVKRGADDYLVKDRDTSSRLVLTVQKLRDKIELKRELNDAREELSKRYSFENTIIGTSHATKELYRIMDKASQTSLTVLIQGETGTGKDLVAKAIHYNSERKGNPFVSINVAALTPDMLAQELFGSVAADGRHKAGKMEEAANGTLFLDEVAELDAAMQGKLMQIIQEKQISPVGSSKIITVQARLICASSGNLSDLVKQGKFREDLYYRMLVLPIVVPPLRDRGNDVLLIANHFVERFCADNQLAPKTLSQDAKVKLLKHPFPGNVRELKSVMELACVMCDENIIDASHINTDTGGYADPLLFGSVGSLKELNKKIIQYHLDRNHYDVLKVAKILDIGKSTIYRMIQNNELSVNTKGQRVI